MYPLTLETDYRPSAPAAARGQGTNGQGANGDLFAELLRQHADAKDPAPRSSNDDSRSDDSLTSSAPAPRDRATDSQERTSEHSDDQPVVDDPAAQPDDAGRDVVERQADSRDGNAKPDVANDTRPASDPAESPVEVAATPTASAAASPTSPAATPAVIPPTTQAMATPVPSAPAASAAPAVAPTTPAAPADPASAMPSAPAAPATVPANPPAGAASAAPAAVPIPATSDMPAGKAAAPQLADALPNNAAGDASGGVPGGVPGDADLQISRAPAAAASSTAVAQGLGKLGSGAEIALAAQAAGDAVRGSAAGDAPGTAKKLSTGTAQQTSATAPADGKPANGTQAATAGAPTTAATAPSAPVQQASMGTPVAASFEAALNGAAANTEGSPGGTTGLGTLPGTGPHGATGAAAATLPKAHAAPGAPAEQLGVHIQRAVRDGNSRITVQLNPVELGQVEVHLDFARDGRVSATILADRPDTLDMLQRDARLLERSLQDAGLQTGSGSLSFDLRDGGRQGFGAQYQANGNDGNNTPAHSDNRKTVPVEQAPPALTGITDSGVDIHV